MIHGLESFDAAKMWEAIVLWFTDYLLIPNTLYQGIIIILAFSFGYFFYRLAKSPVEILIERSDLPGRAKRIANNLRKLLFPFMTLLSLFMTTRIASSEAIGVDVGLINGMMKVLLAWIAIRIIVQFIDNNAVRNVFAMMIWCVAALSIFGLLDQTTEILDSIGFSIGDFRLSALAVIKSVVYLFILIYVATFVSSFAERRVLKSTSLKRSSQVLIAKIIRVVLIAIAILIGVNISGIDLSLFAVFGGAIGLGIGFGLQKGISNLFSGMLLLVD